MKKICLFISLLGILILLYSITIPLKDTKISSIDTSLQNKQVQIKGQVSNIQIHKNKFTTFTITDSSGKIQGNCNCPNIKPNKTLIMKGTIQQYKNKPQIKVEKINVN